MSINRRDIIRKVGLAGGLIAIPGTGGLFAGRAEASTCKIPTPSEGSPLPAAHARMNIGGETVLVDLAACHVGGGERAVVLDADGQMIIDTPSNYEGWMFAGERSGMLQAVPAPQFGSNAKTRNKCIIIGKVIERART